ncbi:hypothetical protein LR48_Vigan05g113400 [Vigna angularis]|uniref:Uncharacterized protein n=1 Tax=Phaseolus angularis TaxID=3914 RepID=A0A0L9UKY2_PHAAN|nr:hypothetical protein LR48_Vigan05g113400 [Vigna angularis]
MDFQPLSTTNLCAEVETQKLDLTAEFLRDARAKNDRMVEEYGQLKVAPIGYNEREHELIIENKTLSGKLERENEKINRLNNRSCLRTRKVSTRPYARAANCRGGTDRVGGASQRGRQ